MYASFLGISEALHLGIFHQLLRGWFFEGLPGILDSSASLNVYSERAYGSKREGRAPDSPVR
jgi:hypothetical protein